jgi:hypothetical protein
MASSFSLPIFSHEVAFISFRAILPVFGADNPKTIESAN